MSKFEDFIVEIGTEELPPKEQVNLVTAFANNLTNALTAAGLNFSEVKTFATPRRLAVLINKLELQQPEQNISKRGPAIAAAYNPDGTPTKAALGFATSCGVTMQELTKQETDKGTWLYFEQKAPGKKTIDLLPEMVTAALAKLPIKKPMRWGVGEFAFVRPVHWILMMLGKEIVKAKIFGLESSNYTQGHRIHCTKAIKITVPESYEKQLETEGKVIADFEKRKQLILNSVEELATKENGHAVINEDLLNMVTGLVELPVALIANFNKEFLDVPMECLISSMQDHQKSFAIVKKDNSGLLPKFILISNINSTDPQTVIRGNELVMHARLADAAFYYKKDKQQRLEDRVEQLKTVTYVKKLGTLHDKIQRIRELSKHIAPYVKADTKITDRAALLCKADLLTSMVYEFPELQGTMGCYYAKHDNENSDVAIAIQEHYKPRFAQDELPETPAGICLSIADRIDSLVGMFGIGNIPTGEKDPYGLRRQVIAIIRLIIEKNIDLDIGYLFVSANSNYNGATNNPTNQLLDFYLERLKAWYLSKGIPAKTFAAVAAITKLDPSKDAIKPLDFHHRINAVVKFQDLEAANNLAAANKRVQNILEKNPADKKEISPALFSTNDEKELLLAIDSKTREIEPLQKSADYSAILKSLATLQTPVDNFFTNVMVMVDDEKVRNNRLNLLQRLRNLFLQVADVSLL